MNIVIKASKGCSSFSEQTLQIVVVAHVGANQDRFSTQLDDGAGNFLSWGTVPIKVNDDRGTVTREAKGNFAPNTPSGARNDYYLPA